MVEIRNGIREKIDTSLYAYPNIEYKEMEKIRKRLTKEKEVKLENKQDKEISIKEKVKKSSKLSNIKNFRKETKKELTL